MVEVKQDSSLGRLAMSALAERYCGPPCDLSDLGITVSRCGDHNIWVSFYDMSVTLNSGHKSYSSFDRTLSEAETQEKKKVNKR